MTVKRLIVAMALVAGASVAMASATLAQGFYGPYGRGYYDYYGGGFGRYYGSGWNDCQRGGPGPRFGCGSGAGIGSQR